MAKSKEKFGRTTSHVNEKLSSAYHTQQRRNSPISTATHNSQ